MATYDGRKVSAEIENPIDNILIYFSEIISPGFKKIGFTSNGLTTISLLLGSASLYHLYNHDLTKFTLYASFSYLFDVMDGYYARKYNMMTQFGDKYDHFKNIIMVLIGVFIVYKQYGIHSHPILIVIGLVLMVLGLINAGCQEKLKTNQKQDDILKILDPVTPNTNNCSDYARYLKYFGSGSLVVIGICLIWYLEHSNSSNQSNVIDIHNISGIMRGNPMDTSIRDIEKTVTHCKEWTVLQFLDPFNNYFDHSD